MLSAHTLVPKNQFQHMKSEEFRFQVMVKMCAAVDAAASTTFAGVKHTHKNLFCFVRSMRMNIN